MAISTVAGFALLVYAKVEKLHHKKWAKSSYSLFLISDACPWEGISLTRFIALLNCPEAGKEESGGLGRRVMGREGARNGVEGEGGGSDAKAKGMKKIIGHATSYRKLRSRRN